MLFDIDLIAYKLKGILKGATDYELKGQDNTTTPKVRGGLCKRLLHAYWQTADSSGERKSVEDRYIALNERAKETGQESGESSDKGIQESAQE
jgi:hypothetical protein